MVTNAEDLTYYPTFDGNGNVMGYYAANTGASVAAFEYGPFGELIRATGEKKDDFNFRFSTKYEDTETGLLYYGYRYYNAETGRWLNRDPIEEQGGLNLYGSVGNDAVNAWDYLGLSSECDKLFKHLETVENIIGNYLQEYSHDADFLERLSAQLNRFNRSNLSISGTTVGAVNSAAEIQRGINSILRNRNVKNFLRREFSPQEYIRINRSSRIFMGKLNSVSNKLKPLGKVVTIGSVAYDIVDLDSAVRRGDNRQKVQSSASLGLTAVSFFPGAGTMVLVGSAPIQISIHQTESALSEFEKSIERARKFDANMIILKGVRKRDEIFDQLHKNKCLEECKDE